MKYLCFMQRAIRRIFRYFIQGLIVLTPIAATFGLVYYIFSTLDIKIEGAPRGTGFIVVILFILTIGYMSSRFLFGKMMLEIFDSILEKIPGLKIVYTSIKDFAEGFVGEKRKFKRPVLITMQAQPEIQRIGFITQDDLNFMDLPQKVMVYIPHSYNFSGNLFLVDKNNISKLDIDATLAMKLAVTGGVAGLPEEEDKKNV